MKISSALSSAAKPHHALEYMALAKNDAEITAKRRRGT